MDNETQKKQKGSFSTKQAFGIILFVVSFVVMLCLISAGKLFGMLGVEIFHFVLGAFGYSAYAVFLFLIYLGLSIFADLKLKIKKRTLAFLFLSLLFLIFIVHIATAAGNFAYSFGEYSKRCFEQGLEGLSTSTFGGVVFGFPCFFLAKMLSVPGSYVVCSLLLVLMLALLFDVKKFWNKHKTDGFGRTKKVKAEGVKDYDLSDVPPEETLEVAPVAQKLFVADVDDFLPKRGRKKSEALDILLNNQTPNASAEKITFMNGKMYTAKEDIAEKLGADIFKGETSYSDAYTDSRPTKEKKQETVSRPPKDRRSLILTPPENIDEYLQNLSITPESRKARGAEPPRTDIVPPAPGKIQATDLRGEIPPEVPEEPREVNRYENYANGIFIDNTEKDRRKRAAAERAAEEPKPAPAEEPPFAPAPPKANLYGGSADIYGDRLDAVPEQRPIISQPAPKAQDPATPDFERLKPEPQQPPIISGSTRPAEERREEPVSSEILSDPRTAKPSPEFRSDPRTAKPAEERTPILSNSGTGEVSYHEQKPVDFESEDDRPEPKSKFDLAGMSAPEEAKIPDAPVYDDSTIVTMPKKPRKYIYSTPPVELLNDFSFNPNSVEENFEERKEVIEQTLSNFRIDAKVVNIVPGPSVTRYELQMPPGIPVNRVIQRADDLAMAVASSSGVRIEAPIPGKSLVGIEVPNKKRQMVVLRDVLDNPTFFAHQSPIVFALGKEIDGKNMLCDIAKMPHLLVAGSTGSGKSVCLNALILSILFKASPEDVRIILIDPKRVEFTVYGGLPHLLLKDIITDVDKAISALNWTVGEMTRRFDLFKQVGAKDITSYNQRIDRETTEKLPRIVVIVDELAELMATKAKADVELKIQRITQLSRAAGIHLVLATQRPSVDVITGVIKANLPSRIAFRVSSQVDSRTILDAAGGEKLLGNGDMIYTTPSVQTQMRLQGPFVSMEEVEAVVDYIKTNNEAYFDELIEQTISNVKPPQSENEEKGGGSEEEEDSGVDKIFVDALRLAIESGQISISMVQRRFSVGYARAGKLIDEMEKMGFVSPFEGSKPRKVLLTMDEFNQRFGGDL